MGFPRQEYWRGCHFILQGIFPTQGSNLCLPCLLHWQVDCLPLSHLGRPIYILRGGTKASWICFMAKLFDYFPLFLHLLTFLLKFDVWKGQMVILRIRSRRTWGVLSRESPIGSCSVNLWHTWITLHVWSSKLLWAKSCKSNLVLWHCDICAGKMLNNGWKFHWRTDDYP